MFLIHEKRLTKNQELGLLRKIKQDKTAKEQIIAAYFKLIIKTATKFKSFFKTVPLEDLISEGIVGLIMAIERYDTSRETSFCSFAHQYIKTSIFQFIRKNTSGLYIPNNKKYSADKLKKYVSSYKRLHGKLPTITEMCKHMNCNVKKLEDLQLINSLQSSSQEPQQAEKNPYVSLEISLLFERLKSFDQQDQDIIMLRYSEERYSWREIGQKLNLSHETARKRYYTLLQVIKV